MASKDTKDDDIKKLSPTELSADELAKAIETQAKAADTATATKKSSAKKTKTETETESTPEPEAKPVEDDSTGVPIIVKRRNSYINKSSSSDDLASESAAQPPSAAPKVKIKPDSDKLESPASKDASTEPSGGEDPAEKATEEPEVVEPSNPEVSAEPVKTESTSAEIKPDSTSDKIASEVTEEPAPSLAVDSSEGATASSKNSTEDTPPPVSVPPSEPNSEEAIDPNAQQKPTVFDTSQYHLPIKVRNSRYLSGAVSWTILTLVFVLVGGYVMYKLEVLDLSQFGL